ncbi:MAG TPA: hypothetical protein VJ986_09065 [Gaiellaceae bacterium]|nr:hypothetical protein [Gaiellaceae bacterium]
MSFWHRVIAAAGFVSALLVVPQVRAVSSALPGLVAPDEKSASDTIRNASIRSRETSAETTVQVPLAADLGAAVDGLRDEIAAERDARVAATALDGAVTATVRAAESHGAALQSESELRIRPHRRLRAPGIGE